MEIYKDKNESIKARVDDLLSRMTLKEKIGQCVQKYIFKNTFDENYDKLNKMLEDGDCGSIILAFTAFAGDDTGVVIDINVLNKIQKNVVENSRLGIPVIFGKDIIHGCRTTFPIPLAQAATWDYDLIKKSASIMAREANATGVNWTFAPMLDVCRDPRWGRIIETPGEDPCLGSMVARASVDGIQGDDMSKPGKIAACAKHYIGYGASQGGRDYQTTIITDYSLKNTYLKAFKAAVDSGVATVMSSFNDIDGEPVSGSEYYIRQLLKKDLNFDGFVVSDWGSIQRLNWQGTAADNKDCALQGMNAGVDMDMCTPCYSDNMEELIKENKIPQEYLDDAVRRILTIKMKLGLFENPYFEAASNSLMTDDDIAHARKIASHSMVLLKNDNILPIKSDAKVALIGPLADDKESMLGAWHADGNPADSVTLLEALINELGADNVIYKPNFAYDPNHLGIRDADYVIAALGEGNYRSGEAHSVTDISLPNFQVDIVKQAHNLGKRVIAVVFAGRPLALTEILPYADAILYAWHPGIQAGNAVADILYGKFVPCGKLPVTIPSTMGQIPIYYNDYASSGFLEYYTSKPTAYRVNYEDALGKPLFPFGYGLSYTDYEYSDICADKHSLTREQINGGEKFNLSISVKNIGKYSSYETVQLYIHDVVASRMRPVRELKAFKKVFIEAGQEVKIDFSIGKEELKFYGKNKKFEVESGKFEIYIGTDCYAENMCEVIVTD